MALFPADFALRSPVKVTDKLLIHNIDTGVTEYTTVEKLTALVVAALALKAPLTNPIFTGQVRLGTSIYVSDINQNTLNSGYETDGAADIWVNYRGYNNGHTQFRDFIIGDGKGNNIAKFIGSTGNVGFGIDDPKSRIHAIGLPIYANNAAALAGGLTAGAFYRTNADPDPVCVVH